MRLSNGIWLPSRPGVAGASVAAGGGGAASNAASLSITNMDTWYDAEGGSFASPGGIFKFSTQDCTVELWFKPPVGGIATNANKPIVESPDTFKTFKMRSATNGAVQTYFGGEWVISANGVLVDNEWRHVAVGWDASAGTAYTMSKTLPTPDTAWTTRGSTPQADPTTYYNFRISSYGADGAIGKWAEIRVWDHLRTAQQITDNYAGHIDPAASGLVALWLSANTVTDSINVIADEAADATDDAHAIVNGTNAAYDAEDYPF